MSVSRRQAQRQLSGADLKDDKRGGGQEVKEELYLQTQQTGRKINVLHLEIVKLTTR